MNSNKFVVGNGLRCILSTSLSQCSTTTQIQFTMKKCIWSSQFTTKLISMSTQKRDMKRCLSNLCTTTPLTQLKNLSMTCSRQSIQDSITMTTTTTRSLIGSLFTIMTTKTHITLNKIQIMKNLMLSYMTSQCTIPLIITRALIMSMEVMTGTICNELFNFLL